MKKILTKTLISALIMLSSCTNFEFLTGSGEKGFVDGSLIDAKFDNPTGMDVDDSGNLYVIDQNYKVIRKVTPEGKVYTVIDFKDKRSDTFKIKGNYLYFSDDGSNIKRFNLKGEVKIENFVGSNEKGDVTGDFEIVRFNNIDAITSDNGDNLFILDNTNYNDIEPNKRGYRIKKVSLKTRKVEAIEFQIEDSTTDVIRNDSKGKTISYLGGVIELLNINPKTDLLHFCQNDTFIRSIFQVNSKNQIIDMEISNFPDSFTFDNEGNMYVVSIAYEKLLKISPDNKKTEELSSFAGVLQIEKGYNFPESGGSGGSNLAVDNNRKILYMSATRENKIFKINLKR